MNTIYYKKLYPFKQGTSGNYNIPMKKEWFKYICKEITSAAPSQVHVSDSRYDDACEDVILRITN